MDSLAFSLPSWCMETMGNGEYWGSAGGGGLYLVSPAETEGPWEQLLLVWGVQTEAWSCI